ncbi:MAG: hypothetical protein OSJ60_08835 [Lachnospiraceae bacterium]|nr:hypothetical protein [Lachnospiraceae bacterium]
MKIYRMEDYYIQTRIGHARPTGNYEITRIGTRRAVTKFVETYKTNAGEILPDEWKKIVKNCAEVSDSQALLNKIIEHCCTHCVWLKNENDREEYALDILAGRIYRNWKGFSTDGLSEKTAFMFIF